MMPLTRCGLLFAIAMTAASTALAETVDLYPSAKAWAEPVRVETRLRIEGRVTPEVVAGAKADPQSVSVEVQLAYQQEGLKPEGDQTRRVMRQVERASSTLPGAAGLRDDHRSLVARAASQGSRVAAVAGPLTRAELDLIELPADPLDLAGLLPAGPTRDGGTWKIDAVAVGQLLRLEADTLCEVTGIVSDVTARHAKLRFAGPVHGHVDGAEIEIELRGIALFDRALGRLTRVNLGWKETRKVGPATPALEATAKLNLEIAPAAADDQIAVTDLLLAETTRLDERVRLTTGDGAWHLLGDRDWFVVASGTRATTLRRVEAGRLAAVTTLTPASRRDLTAKDFEREVRYSLGGQLNQVIGTERGVTPSGLATDALSSVGTIDGKPVEWRHHLIAGEPGTLTATTTLPSLEGPADDTAVRRLIGSIAPAPNQAETAAAKATAVRR